MRLIFFAAALLLLLSSSAWAACGPDSAPATVQAYGITCETFHDGPFTLGTIDINNTATFGNPVGSCASGSCNWYTDPNMPNLINGAGCPGGGSCPATTSAQYSISGGALTLSRTSAYTAGRVDLATCKGAGMSAGQYIGQVFSPPFYVEFTPTTITTGFDSATAEAAIWLLPIGYLVDGVNTPENGIEIDVVEGGAGLTKSFHDFTVAAGPAQTEWFQNVTAPVVGHTTGFLVLPQTRNPNNDGYTTGLTLNLDNGSVVSGEAITFGSTTTATFNGGAYGTASIPPGSVPDTRTGALALSANSSKFCILLGSGFGKPLTLTNVRVWQLPPAGAGRGRPLW